MQNQLPEFKKLHQQLAEKLENALSQLPDDNQQLNNYMMLVNEMQNKLKHLSSVVMLLLQKEQIQREIDQQRQCLKQKYEELTNAERIIPEKKETEFQELLFMAQNFSSSFQSPVNYEGQPLNNFKYLEIDFKLLKNSQLFQIAKMRVQKPKFEKLEDGRYVLKAEFADGIFYTTDGSEPNELGKTYTRPIKVTSDMKEIRAVAFKQGLPESLQLIIHLHSDHQATAIRPSPISFSTPFDFDDFSPGLLSPKSP